jgi:hypothetical protein
MSFRHCYSLSVQDVPLYPQAQEQISFAKQILCFSHLEYDFPSNSSQLMLQFFPKYPGLLQRFLLFSLLSCAFKFLHMC